MDKFFPFIFEKEKKQIEQQPLYIEILPPYQEKKEDKEEQDTVIIIDL